MLSSAKIPTGKTVTYDGVAHPWSTFLRGASCRDPHVRHGAIFLVTHESVEVHNELADTEVGPQRRSGKCRASGWRTPRLHRLEHLQRSSKIEAYHRLTIVYKKYQHVPLYLKWAPVKVFDRLASAASSAKASVSEQQGIKTTSVGVPDVGDDGIPLWVLLATLTV
ncbi:putative RNA-binding protein 19 [Phytophthora pseudosyringae]|uniref:Putative RNA-binding protein 19 n=1 Tax=Phytophthora pseudosyringae TaxID=221518 RepID=A0A8T1VCW5_9STRA|nr:putative RNA-binding protein 19 [Phytophthora pseudosyringae]